jgi:hypothetical protein
LRGRALQRRLFRHQASSWLAVVMAATAIPRRKSVEVRRML